MFSVRSPGASLWSLTQRWLDAIPSQCVVCRTWQDAPLCGTCRSLWRYPVPRCTRCAIDLPASDKGVHQDVHGDVCQACEDQSPEFDRAIAALHYTAPWSPLLAQLKFQGATALAKPLGDLMADAVAARRGGVSVVLPVPLSKQRLIERGYNQSWLLARQVARRLNLPARHDLLERSQHTSRLMAMSAEERRLQIQGAFEVTDAGRAWLRGRDVAIVDDVMTTGATLNTVAMALQDAGVRSVSAWVVARTPTPVTRRPRASTSPTTRLADEGI